MGVLSKIGQRMMKRKQRKKQRQKQRKLKKYANNNNHNSLFIPQEIINNILIRLPVKSLLRFQCVCKEWRSLIKSKSFTSEHLHHSSVHNPRMIFADSFPSLSKKFYLLNKEFQIASVLPTPCPVSIIGSSNGLLCLTTLNLFSPFVLWNPATRQRRLVPKPADTFCHGLGFGFNSSVNDYNIVTIDHVPCGGGLVQAQVYSLKTGLWKEVDSSALDHRVRDICETVVDNGTMFWLGHNNNDELVLISYDMALEVFAMMSLPISSSDPLSLDPHYICLTLHENKVSILSSTSCVEYMQSHLTDMWVMEDGTGESCGWTKKFSIIHSSRLIVGTIWRGKMVSYLKGPRVPRGKELHVYRKNIHLVDLTTNEVNVSDIGLLGEPSYLLNHVESLVPVDNNHIEEL